MQDLLNHLREVRADLGITQVELAYQSGVSLPTVQNIEAHRANPSLETLSALANQLGLELTLRVKPANWEALCFYGLPLMDSGRHVPGMSPRPEAMIQNLREASLELFYTPDSPERTRKLEAVQAF